MEDFSIKKLKEKSLEKWEEIRENLKAKNKLNWEDKYWLECGYCETYIHCEDCTLYHQFISGLPVCRGAWVDDYSHAWATISLASDELYAKALYHCDKVIDFIKKDLGITT